jgi:DNA-binding PadR family transcriptional regulator
MGDEPRITLQTLKVLSVFLDQPTSDRYGLEICDLTGLKYGTVQPMLRRFDKAGWLKSAWEDIDPKEAGRRPRRYYKLSSKGLERARDVLRETQQLHAVQPQPALGVSG